MSLRHAGQGPGMKVCIYGAGAVGGHLAAKLARSGVDLSVVVRGPHLAAIRARGLRFEGAADRFTVRPAASDDPRDLGPQDVVITAVKASGLPAIAGPIQALLKPATAVVYVANGIPWWYFHGIGGAQEGRRLERLDPGGALWDGVGVGRAIGCVIYSPNDVPEPGVVRATGRADRFVLGEPDGSRSPRVQAIAGLLEAAGFAAPVSDRIRHEVWTKLSANMSASPIVCLTHSNGGEAARNPELRPIYRALSAECAAVAAAYGVTLAADPDAWLDTMRDSTHRASMLQDLEAGRAMEIDAQLVAVQDLARSAGVATPIADVVIALLKHRARLAGLYQG